MSETKLLEGSQVTDVQVVGTDTYTLFTRIDGFYVIMKNNEEETEYRFYIGLDEVKKNPGSTPNMDADWGAPDGSGIVYERLNTLSNVQKSLLMKARASYRDSNQRDFT